MEKIFYTLIINVLSFYSCNELLDEMPDNRLLIDTPEKVQQTLTNAYPQIGTTLISEFSSDNIDDIGADNIFSNFLTRETAYWQTILEYSNTDGLQNIWDYHYKAIGQANTALYAIENTLANASSLNPAKGEALVARAYAHFCLANLFCQAYNPNTSSSDLGIPYIKEPEEKLDPKYSRETVAQVYEQIATDLATGLPLIEDSYYQMPKYHFNKKAAYAFAARFYLYYQKWDKALEAANVVLTENDATTKNMLREWIDFRDAQKTGTKSIEAYSQAYARESEVANLMLQPVYSAISTDYFILTNQRFAHAYRVSEQETMGTTNLWDVTAESKNNGYEYYWFSPFTTRADLRDIVLQSKFPTFKDGSYTKTILVPFTTDETLLVRAEAKIMLGELDKAVTDINMFTSKYIRGKINYNPNGNTFTKAEITNFYNNLAYSQSTSSGATQKKKLNPSFTISSEQEPLLHYVLQCRRILTLHEGLRWQDIKRYNIEVARYQHTKEERNNSTIQGILTSNDPRRAIQLPGTAIGAGMQANPR
ncbi:MAG: RagB/SusD family nutrient uptake outer membrane protein [Capnocytophaga sp.]|nr:RagB/SusD family nutrient uptake outer membrane protein [Capnocytophaga sp.]